MTKRSLATGTLLLALGSLAACGDDDTDGTGSDPTTSPSPSTSAGASPSTAATEEPSPTSVAAPALATTPTLLQCLVQDGLLAGGPTDTELADGVASQRIWVTLSDGSEFDPVTGALHVLTDEAQATAYADQLLAKEIADGEVPGDTATVSVHGNVVRVLESELSSPPSGFDQTLLGCLPGADPATAVAPPAAGSVTLASLMECAETVGMSGFGEHSFFDVDEQRSGSVIFRTPNDYGGYDELATVYVFADAATAEAREAATIGDQEPRLFERRGNAIGRFLDTLDASDPTRDTVLGCMPG
jgi:hypothetical protein